MAFLVCSSHNHVFILYNVTNTHRFQTAVTTADELTAVTQAIRFKYDDGRTYLAWTVGDTVDPALYVILSPAHSKERSREIHRTLRNMLPTRSF